MSKYSIDEMKNAINSAKELDSIDTLFFLAFSYIDEIEKLREAQEKHISLNTDLALKNDLLQNELRQWKDGYWYHRNGAEQLEKEIQIVKDVCKTELISYLETIKDTTECEATKKYIEVVLFGFTRSK